MRNTRLAIIAFASLLPAIAAAQSGVQYFPQTIPGRTILGRGLDTPGPVTALPMQYLFSNAMFDTVLGSTRGSVPYRGASGWTTLTPSTSGYLLKSGGAGADPSWQSLPLPVSIGGTGSTTAAGARSASNLNIEGFTGHGDSIYTILSTDRTVGTTAALTTSRTWTLPAASSVNAGQEILVVDMAGGVTSANTLVIQRSGSDTVNGSTSVTVRAAYGGYRLRSDGSSKWAAMAISSSASGGLSDQIKTPLDYGAACNAPSAGSTSGATDDTTALQAWLDAIRSNGAVGFIPAGRNCAFSGWLGIRSGTTIYGYGASLRIKNSSGAGSGLMWANGSIDYINGADNVAIFGLTVDGNRANQTNTQGEGALFYMIGSTRITLRDVRAINGRGDGFGIGGAFSAGGAGSTFFNFANIEANGNYRTGLAVYGAQRGHITGSIFNSNSNTNNDGTQCGVDIEADLEAGPNAYITITNSSAVGNGGTLSTTGGSGFCFFGSYNSNLYASGLTASSNQRYGFDSANSGEVRISGAFGVSNGTSLLHGYATDSLGAGGGSLPSGTSGGLMYYTGAAWASSNAFTANGILYGAGAGNPPSATAAMTNGQLLVGQTSSAPLPKTMSGDATLAASGALTIANGAVTGTKTASNTMANSNLAQAGAATLKGNPTGSTADVQDFTIQGLTNKASPDTSNDKILIYDNTAGTFKYSTVGQISSAGASGVSSLGGATGAITTSNGVEVSGSNLQLTAARRTLPTTTVLTSGTNATYTTPANVLWLEITMVGGGGGGGGAGNGGTNGSAGGDTCWKTSGTACTTPDIKAGGGAGTTGQVNAGAGGTGTGGDVNIAGSAGGNSLGASSSVFGGSGGLSTLGGAGRGAAPAASGSPTAGSTNSGSGGGGGTTNNASYNNGAGGSAGATVKKIITSPAATYVYTIGAGGTAGSAGTSGLAGEAGGSGIIIVVEHYNS